MACYRPIPAFQRSDGSICFKERHGDDIVRSLQLSCGQCVGCRLERSRQWAVRCMHEASLHRENAFVTLTYDDAHVPPDGSLRYRDFQLFMKRLRFHADRPIRFYMCGEYGETTFRPHFHACLFGWNFHDRRPVRLLAVQSRVYRSGLLEALWPYGFSSIGEVNFESAAYVARYVMKKITGDAAEEHYRVVNVETGEVSKRVPEFCRMSLKPGIGRLWYDRFHSDVYPSGSVVVRGKQARPPRYYDRLCERQDPDAYAAVCFLRDSLARASAADNTDRRLSDREVVAKARLRQLKRAL